MSVPTACLIIFVLILLNGVFAMGEMALVSARPARFADLEERGVKGASRAKSLAGDPQRFLPTVQVGITLVSVLEGSFGGAQLAGRLAPLLARVHLLRHVANELAFALVVIAITFLMLVLGELVPKQLALTHPERIAIRLSRMLGALSRVAAPIVWVLGGASGAVLRLVGAGKLKREAVTEEELRALLAESARVGVVEHQERDMIERLLRLADKSVRAIMTPRNELVWIDRHASRTDIATALRGTGLVVCDGGPDNPVGVLRVQDVLDELLSDDTVSISGLLHKPTTLPDSISALDALGRIRGDRIGLALVLDEYGSFEGIVTPVDVMASIVFDVFESSHSKTAEEGTPAEITLDGMTPVDEVKERLRLPELPAAGSYHTLAGLVLALLRRVPAVGDQVVFAGWLFEVLAVDGRRVDRVRASRQALAEE